MALRTKIEIGLTDAEDVSFNDNISFGTISIKGYINTKYDSLIIHLPTKLLYKLKKELNKKLKEGE